MDIKLSDLIINFATADLAKILAAWRWQTQEQKGLIFISKLGDLFLLGKDEGVYWLQTDCGDLTKIADSRQHFETLLRSDENLDNWFLPGLIDKLEKAGKFLQTNQVYSYGKLPVMGGEYSVDNITPVDVYAHFGFTGQICEQIQNLPDGTAVEIVVKK